MRTNLFAMLALALLMSACGSDISTTDHVIVGGACEAATDCPCPADYEVSCESNQCLCLKTETTEVPVEIDCHTNGCACPDGTCTESGVCECPTPVPEETQRVYFSNGSIGTSTVPPGAKDVVTFEFQMSAIQYVKINGLKVHLYFVGYDPKPLTEITKLITSATLAINGFPVATSSTVENVSGPDNESGNVAFGFPYHGVPAYTLVNFSVRLSLRDDVPLGTQFITALIPCNDGSFDNVSVADENGQPISAHPGDPGCDVINGSWITVK